MKDIEFQSRWPEFFDPLKPEIPPSLPTQQRTGETQFYPSFFVQKRIEFDTFGNCEEVLERVASATVAISLIDGTSGGFDTEFIISPQV